MTDVDVDRLVLQVEALVAQATSDDPWVTVILVVDAADSWRAGGESEWVEDDEYGEAFFVRRTWKRATLRRMLVRTVDAAASTWHY